VPAEIEVAEIEVAEVGHRHIMRYRIVIICKTGWGTHDLWFPTHFTIQNADPSTALRTKWMGHGASLHYLRKCPKAA
jgi:hypothetical protein